MSQDSSDEESEEDEDFARVQFGSRYTAAQCVLTVCELLLSDEAQCMCQWDKETNCTNTSVQW